MLRSSHHHDSSGQTVSFRDFAILYRTHAIAKNIRRRLDDSGLPYQIAGEGSPYSQKEVRDILAGLRYLAGHDLDQAQWSKLLDPLKSSDQPISSLATQIATRLGYEPKGLLRQFLNNLIRFDGQALDTYLTHVDTIAEQDFYDPDAHAVTLLTIHASKGLEFSHVFLIGTEENILPYQSAKGQTNHDEEKRLFYVAVTRAKHRLDILHAKKRQGSPATLSKFVTSLPESALPCLQDPALPNQIKKIQKHQLKRSQTSLF